MDRRKFLKAGAVGAVAAQTILPKGRVGGSEIVQSKMLESKSTKQAYIFDYQQTVPGLQPETHFA